MAVEAQHLNLFPPQLIPNKEVMMNINGNIIFNSSNNNNNNNTQIGYGGLPISGTTTVESFIPMYNSTTTALPGNKNPMKDDSGLTYSMLPRKRLRDDSNSINQQQQQQQQQKISIPNTIPVPSSSNYSKGYNRSNTNPNGCYSFMGEDLSLQIFQQQSDIDHLISQHMERVRMVIEERRKRNCRRVAEVVEEGIMKRLRAKEEEIEKIGRLNWALEERVKSLAVENQIWKDLAQTNEATANALRTSLEHVLAQVNDVPTTANGGGSGGLEDEAALNDDAESCCGSSGGGGNDQEVEEVGWRTIARNGGVGKLVKDNDGCSGGVSGGGDVRRRCRNCGKGEACVLLLPCRHLCLCTVCGSSLHTCPVCKSYKNASVHVNVS